MDEQALAVTTTTTTTEEMLQPTNLPTPSPVPTVEPVLVLLQGEIISMREQITTLQNQLQAEANQELQHKLEALQNQMTEMNDRLSLMQVVSEPEPEPEPEEEVILAPVVDDTQSHATEETTGENANGAGIGEMFRNLLFGRKETTK